MDAGLSPTGARLRLAALAALGAVVAMAVVAVVALFGEPSGLVVALVLLAIAAGAAWLRSEGLGSSRVAGSGGRARRWNRPGPPAVGL